MHATNTGIGHHAVSTGINLRLALRLVERILRLARALFPMPEENRAQPVSAATQSKEMLNISTFFLAKVKCSTKLVGKS
jgi:hypothetical protein